MKYCRNCGKEIEEGQKFCKHCGAEVRSASSKTSIHKKKFGKLPKLSKKQKIIASCIGAAALLVIIAFIAWLIFTNFHHHAQAAPLAPNNAQAVVDIVCDNGFGGSGTIFTTTGTILTNNHVITGSTSCKVTIPNPATGQISEIYEAAPVIVPVLSKKYDVATLQIDASYTDAKGKTWGAYPTTFTPFTLPSTCSTSSPSNLGDSVRIYGYPVTSGGYNLTETDGIISSFADDGNILTSTKVDSGNSGGLAIDQNGCYLGIPSAIISGNYQNLGVIIPGNVVKQFIPNIPVKADLVTKTTGTQDEAAQEAITPQVAAPVTTSAPDAPQETPEEDCEATYGTYSDYLGNNAQGEPLCGCQTGYSWSADGSSCEAQTDLQAYCQTMYGTESYSSPIDGKAECSCSDGYEWNSSNTQCVASAESNDETCKTQYGDGSEWDGSTDASGGPECDCQSGYAWNSGQTECVSTSCTADATYDSSTGECECDSGYTDSDGYCEDDTLYCENKDGFGATYDSTTNSCACSSGYVAHNGTCEDGYLYCEEEYGYDYEYDSDTNGCTPDSY